MISLFIFFFVVFTTTTYHALPIQTPQYRLLIKKSTTATAVAATSTTVMAERDRFLKSLARPWSTAVGLLATRYICITLKLTPVKAAAITGLISSITTPQHAASIYCGAFSTMATKPYFNTATGLTTLVACTIASHEVWERNKLFDGYGGRFGTTSAMAGFLALRLSDLHVHLFETLQYVTYASLLENFRRLRLLGLLFVSYIFIPILTLTRPQVWRGLLTDTMITLSGALATGYLKVYTLYIIYTMH